MSEGKWSRFQGSAGAAVIAGILFVASLALPEAGRAQEDRQQTRPAMTRVEVPVDRVRVGDGDTVTIEWDGGDREIVRILGIDTPETQNIEHNLPYDQPFGREAAGFAKGAFSVATKVEVLRATMKDPYGRTLGYIFLNGRNYSELILAARLAEESITRYGDNGFPAEAKACLEVAQAAGPLPFESPGEYRKRMRAVTDWMRSKGMVGASKP